MTAPRDAASSPQLVQAGDDFLPVARLPNHSRAPLPRVKPGTSPSPVNLPPDCLRASGGLFGASYMGEWWQLNEIRKAGL